MNSLLNTNIFTRALVLIGFFVFLCATTSANVRITFAGRRKTRAFSTVALRIAAATGKAILAIAVAIAEFLTKVLRLGARAVFVAWPGMDAGRVLPFNIAISLSDSQARFSYFSHFLLLLRRRCVLDVVLVGGADRLLVAELQLLNTDNHLC